jgi:hypothetical protein
MSKRVSRQGTLVPRVSMMMVEGGSKERIWACAPSRITVASPCDPPYGCSNYSFRGLHLSSFVPCVAISSCLPATSTSPKTIPFSNAARFEPATTTHLLDNGRSIVVVERLGNVESFNRGVGRLDLKHVLWKHVFDASCGWLAD